MFPVVELFAACALFSAAPPQELNLQQVLKANTAAIQAIRSIHVTIEQADNTQFPGEDKPLEPLPTYTIEWYKDGNRERVRQISLRGEGARGKKAPENSDAYNGPDGWKRLEHYDPNFKPPLSESISVPAVGDLDKPHVDDYLSGLARGMSYMEPFNATLEEYMKKHPNCKLAATPVTSKLGCYEIASLEKKHEVGGSTDDVRALRTFVDPKAGFWVRRIEQGPWQKSKDPNDKRTMISEVEEFKDCGNGIFWPMRAYCKIHPTGAEVGWSMFIHHTLHSINKPLPDEDFQIHFPDWLRVYDKASGKVFIWGPENKPRMEFASRAEYKEWYRPRARNPFQPQIRSPREYWTLMVGISVAVALLLLTLITWRRRAARVVGKPSPEAGNI